MVHHVQYACLRNLGTSCPAERARASTALAMIVRHLLVLLLSAPAAAYRLQSGLARSPRTARSRAVTATADGDALAALKRSFYGAAVREEVREAADDPPIGLLRDMPLCRWPWEVLPHHQRVIAVHVHATQGSNPDGRLRARPHATCHIARVHPDKVCYSHMWASPWTGAAVHSHVREAARLAGATRVRTSPAAPR